jgi:hypothetical protein
MEMETALQWILRLTEMKYEFKNQAVFITFGKQQPALPLPKAQEKTEPAPEF